MADNKTELKTWFERVSDLVEAAELYENHYSSLLDEVSPYSKRMHVFANPECMSKTFNKMSYKTLSLLDQIKNINSKLLDIANKKEHPLKDIVKYNAQPIFKKDILPLTDSLISHTRYITSKCLDTQRKAKTMVNEPISNQELKDLGF